VFVVVEVLNGVLVFDIIVGVILFLMVVFGSAISDDVEYVEILVMFCAS